MQKKKSDTFFMLFLKFFAFISIRLSIKLRNKFGKFLGNLLVIISKQRKLITLNNLKNAFPDKSDDWIYGKMKSTYHNLAITFLELIIMDKLSDNKLDDLVKFKNIQEIIDIYNRKNGLILMSGHFGNWELMAYSVGHFTKIPVQIIVKKQKIADEFYNQKRTSRNNKVVEMAGSAREVIKTLTNKDTIALLADQNATIDKDIFIEFFGRKVPTYKAPAELALRFKVPIIFGVAIRNDDGTYFIDHSEIKHNDLTYSREGVEELTKRHVKLLENFIRKYPELWAWQHKRWKFAQ